MTDMTTCPQVSIVFPVYNEELVLPVLETRLQEVISNLDCCCEVVFVNDGSRDSSLQMLRAIARRHTWAKVVSLSRNFGHQTAVTAGLKNSSGAAVIVMDSDLQDPPELIPRMLELWQADNQVVYCVRRRRKEGLFKRTCYAGFYRIMRLMVDIDIPLDSGDFCLMDRRVVELVCNMPERNQFIRGLRTWVGFRQIALEYERDARHAGEPKYTFKRLVKLALDGILSFSYIPLRIAGKLGMGIAFVSILYAIKLFTWRLLYNNHVPGFATLSIAIMLLGSVQLFTLSILGEYVGRIYDEVKQRPLYIVGERIGFETTTNENALSR